MFSVYLGLEKKAVDKSRQNFIYRSEKPRVVLVYFVLESNVNKNLIELIDFNFYHRLLGTHTVQLIEVKYTVM